MRALVLAGALIVAAGLASPAASRPVTGPQSMGDAMTQPLRDLSIVRRRVPPVLIHALNGPYDAPAPTTCPHIGQEIAALDAALGPDIDTAGGIRRASTLRGLAIDGVRSVMDLPYRGIIRVITGARRRDEALQSAILAGVSRRAFLKGLARSMACEAGGLGEQTTIAAADIAQPVVNSPAAAAPSADPDPELTGFQARNANQALAKTED